MDKFAILQFYALLKREFLEHRNLFLGAPVVLALLLLGVSILVASQLEQAQIASGLEYLAMLFDGLSPFDMAPFFMILAIPFMITLYVCCLIYLVNTLYQDRKEMSVLFWQSMPVSNFKTVLSKVVTVVIVAPLFYVAIIFGLYLIGMIWLTALGIANDIDLVGIGWMFLAALASLVLIYLSSFLASLWLFPTLGWLLLFSAFAKKTPLLWAIGVFFMVGILEDFIFGTQYLANWVESRATNPAQYLIFDIQNVLSKLFNYDMFFGLALGSILVAGAIFMRRYTD